MRGGFVRSSKVVMIVSATVVCLIAALLFWFLRK